MESTSLKKQKASRICTEGSRKSGARHQSCSLATTAVPVLQIQAVCHLTLFLYQLWHKFQA